MPSDYGLKARSDALVANIRSSQSKRTHSPAPAAVAHRVLLLPSRLPELEVTPTTRAVDASGRLAVRIGGRTVAEWLGWEPGPLRVVPSGHWFVCRPDEQLSEGRRNDSTATLGADGRIRLPHGVLNRLGVDGGGEVLVHIDPNERLIAFCSPARIFTGAPLDLHS